MNTKGVNFQPSKRGQFSAAVDTVARDQSGESVITGELKSKIDRVWDAFWSGGISNPLEVIEQITYLLFIRRLDDLQTLAEKQGHASPASRSRIRSSGPDQQNLRWTHFKNDEPGVMYETVAEQVFPFLRDASAATARPTPST